jgi:hypothetical protein
VRNYFELWKMIARCNSYRVVSPLGALPLGDPNGGVVYLRVVLSPEEASRICLCFWKRLSRKRNNVVVFPFAFQIAVQQPFRPLWSRLLLHDHEPSEHHLLCASSSYWCRCFRHQGSFYWISHLLDISLRLVPTLLSCSAWETLLVATLPPA